jgi:hypothetical protein
METKSGESQALWFQPLRLSSDIQVSNLCFQLHLYRYGEGEAVAHFNAALRLLRDEAVDVTDRELEIAILLNLSNINEHHIPHPGWGCTSCCMQLTHRA